MKRVLTRLVDGDSLIHDRCGWRLACGIGRELVNGSVAVALLKDGWVEVAEKTRERASYRIAEAGRAALQEEETP
jgi:hypothetical protein